MFSPDASTDTLFDAHLIPWSSSDRAAAEDAADVASPWVRSMDAARAASSAAASILAPDMTRRPAATAIHTNAISNGVTIAAWIASLPRSLRNLPAHSRNQDLNPPGALMVWSSVHGPRSPTARSAIRGGPEP